MEPRYYRSVQTAADRNGRYWPLSFSLVVESVNALSMRGLDEAIDAVQAWCIDQFGEPSAARWSKHGMLSVHFQRHEDAFAFKMRWC